MNTPKGDYSGVITYSFRARLQEGDQSKINVVMGEGYNTIDSYAHTLTTDWQTYTGEFKKVLLTVVLFSFLLVMKTKF